MAIPRDPITLADWRRTIAGLYARVRESGTGDGAAAAQAFRAARDRLFAHHPQSPIPPARRGAWRGASWFAYDPAWRVSGEFAPAGHIAHFEIPLADDGVVHCARAGTVRFRVREHEAQLAVYWFGGYGGGLWVPFTDGTNGDTTYGGADRYGLARQFLHAHRLAFQHPQTGEQLSFESPLPADLATALGAAHAA